MNQESLTMNLIKSMKLTLSINDFPQMSFGTFSKLTFNFNHDSYSSRITQQRASQSCDILSSQHFGSDLLQNYQFKKHSIDGILEPCSILQPNCWLLTYFRIISSRNTQQRASSLKKSDLPSTGFELRSFAWKTKAIPQSHAHTLKYNLIFNITRSKILKIIN